MVPFGLRYIRFQIELAHPCLVRAHLTPTPYCPMMFAASTVA